MTLLSQQLIANILNTYTQVDADLSRQPDKSIELEIEGRKTIDWNF